MNKENTNALLVACFETIMNTTKDMVFVKNADLIYVAASQPFVNMVGWKEPADLIGKSDFEIFSDLNLAKRYVSDDKKLLSEGLDLVDYIEPITDKDGKHRYGSTSKYILRSDTGELIGIFGITRDITKDYLARQNYQKELKYLFELPEEIYATSYIDVDSWRIITQRRQHISEGTLESCQTVDELSKAAVRAIVDEKSKAAHFYRNFSKDFLRGIFESGRMHVAFEYERQLTSGEIHWVRNELRFLTDVDSGHLCAMLSAQDIDEEKAEEEKIVMAAQMDKMTMLLNRDTTMEYIRGILKEEPDNMHALFMFDVDNFKVLNDTFGHQTGDRLLVDLATVLKDSFRDSDVVGRIGGDEFFAFMRNVSDVKAVERKAQELLEDLQIVCSEYKELQLSESIGIAIYPKVGLNLQELYAKADDALYQAKREGKSKFVFAK